MVEHRAVWGKLELARARMGSLILIVHAPIRHSTADEYLKLVHRT